MSERDVLLRMKSISKTFPGVKALSNVDFTLERGEVHALMGENGAGKSTLIKVLTGVERPEAGVIELEGRPIFPKDPHHAQSLGISAVYQEINLCLNLSVAENIFIGREPLKFGRIDWKTIHQRAQQLLERLDIRLDVQQSLGSFSVAIQQMVAIARALDISAKVLILDEPTSCLDANEVERLFQVMRRLKSEGLGIIFISHFLDQVYAIADRITVLRNSEQVGCYSAATLPRLELVSKMLGKELEDLEGLARVKQAGTSRVSKSTLLEVKNLGRIGKLQPFDLEVNAGEVVGLAGLLGSGRTETAQLLFGVEQPDSGSIKLDGKEIQPLSPAKALKKKIGLCPENRRSDGVVPELTVRENILLALQAGRGWFRRLNRKQQMEITNGYIRALNISTPDGEQLVKNLSGGNQQKVILARWLATDPRLLILDEPTKGIDIGAKTEIQKLILALARDGKAIVFISSEIDEVIRCSQRVMVLRDRQKVTELRGDQINKTWIMQSIAERVSDGPA